MKFKTLAICTGIKESKGQFEGRDFSSTTFHCVVDVAENSAGRSIGAVSRPFKCGDASEFEKWVHLAKSWPATGLAVECEFDMVAGSDNATKLVLLSIKPNTAVVKTPAATA